MLLDGQLLPAAWMCDNKQRHASKVTVTAHTNIKEKSARQSAKPRTVLVSLRMGSKYGARMSCRSCAVSPASLDSCAECSSTIARSAATRDDAAPPPPAAAPTPDPGPAPAPDLSPQLAASSSAGISSRDTNNARHFATTSSAVGQLLREPSRRSSHSVKRATATACGVASPSWSRPLSPSPRPAARPSVGCGGAVGTGNACSRVHAAKSAASSASRLFSVALLAFRCSCSPQPAPPSKAKNIEHVSARAQIHTHTDTGRNSTTHRSSNVIASRLAVQVGGQL